MEGKLFGQRGPQAHLRHRLTTAGQRARANSNQPVIAPDNTSPARLQNDCRLFGDN